MSEESPADGLLSLDSHCAQQHVKTPRACQARDHVQLRLMPYFPNAHTYGFRTLNKYLQNTFRKHRQKTKFVYFGEGITYIHVKLFSKAADRVGKNACQIKMIC